MKAPDFWTEGGAASIALAPLGWAWAAGARLRQARGKPWRAPVPVICVGNLVAGGAGKTPVAMALAAALPDAHLLSKGHGGSERGPHRVGVGDDAARVGDEPLLLAQAAPTWVAHDRVAGARAAAESARALILDDGFQDPSLAKDFSIVVIDGETGFGAGRCIPAGPLRETVADGLARAQAALILGEDRTGLVRDWRGPPLHFARLLPEPAAIARLSGKRVLAFAGIGRPEKFFATLAQLGAEAVERVPFGDHHPYTADEIRTLKQRAEKAGLTLVTTTKDLVRLPSGLRAGIEALPVTLVLAEPEALLGPIRRLLG